MPGLLVFGKEIMVPGLSILNPRDDARLKLSPEDGRKRNTKWIRQIILHTTKGIPGGSNNTPQYIIPGTGPNLGKEFDVAKYWDNDPRHSAAQIIIDVDGSVGCICDLGLYGTYHAAQHLVNDASIGIEMYQTGDAGIYEATLNACVVLVNALTEIFGIQRQVHLPYLRGPVARLAAGGTNCVGVFGHRDVSNNRGLGDPGDIIMNHLVAKGYEKYNFSKGEDLEKWKARQKLLGVDVDGIPGPQTRKALEEAGYRSGLIALWEGETPVDPTPPPPPPVVEEPAELSFWEKIAEFFKKLFGSK